MFLPTAAMPQQEIEFGVLLFWPSNRGTRDRYAGSIDGTILLRPAAEWR